jgi:hypothetical protein
MGNLETGRFSTFKFCGLKLRISVIVKPSMFAQRIVVRKFGPGRDVQHYVITFDSDLPQVGGFLRVLQFRRISVIVKPSMFAQRIVVRKFEYTKGVIYIACYFKWVKMGCLKFA